MTKYITSSWGEIIILTILYVVESLYYLSYTVSVLYNYVSGQLTRQIPNADTN